MAGIIMGCIGVAMPETYGSNPMGPPHGFGQNGAFRDGVHITV